jgi:hypothetical protein
MAAEPEADRQALADVINLGLLWHCLCAITRLEVPERLAVGPLPIPQLAAAVGAQQDALRRVLRLVADHQIVTFQQDRGVLTDRGGLPCREHPSSLQAAFAAVGDSDVAHGLTDTLRTGRAAAPAVLGMPYWDYLAAHPDQQELFDQAMVQRAQALSLACVPVLEWPPSGRSPTSPAGSAPCWRPCCTAASPGRRTEPRDFGQDPHAWLHRPFTKANTPVGPKRKKGAKRHDLKVTWSTDAWSGQANDQRRSRPPG